MNGSKGVSKGVKRGSFVILLATIESIFIFLFLRLDPDPYHSGFVYSQALAVKDGLLPAKEFISPYGIISPLLNGLWVIRGNHNCIWGSDSVVHHTIRILKIRYSSELSLGVDSGNSYAMAIDSYYFLYSPRLLYSLFQLGDVG
jgi:hypothetical protein